MTKEKIIRFCTTAALIICLVLATISQQGCAASKSHEHRAILDWQQEGHYTYKTENGVDYFVKCEDYLKYLGVSRPATNTQDGYYQVVGPVDVCTGEEE